jgi:hypothetical protein
MACAGRGFRPNRPELNLSLPPYSRPACGMLTIDTNPPPGFTRCVTNVRSPSSLPEKRVNRRLEFELGAGFEGACGFALVLALSQMMEHGLGPFEADDRELGFSQAGIKGGDADAGAIELEAPGVEHWFGTFRAASTSGHGAVHQSSTFWQTNQPACAHHAETESS